MIFKTSVRRQSALPPLWKNSRFGRLKRPLRRRLGVRAPLFRLRTITTLKITVGCFSLFSFSLGCETLGVTKMDRTCICVTYGRFNSLLIRNNMICLLPSVRDMFIPCVRKEELHQQFSIPCKILELSLFESIRLEWCTNRAISVGSFITFRFRIPFTML
jgi:hypothetical protein